MHTDNELNAIGPGRFHCRRRWRNWGPPTPSQGQAITPSRGGTSRWGRSWANWRACTWTKPWRGVRGMRFYRPSEIYPL